MSEQLLHSRRRLEAKIDELISLLDLLDGDPDLEPYLADTPGSHRDGRPSDDREGDDSDLEPEETDQNGDEQDCSFHTGEGHGTMYDGSGVAIALRMIEEFPLASMRANTIADAGPTPIVYDFRGMRP